MTEKRRYKFGAEIDRDGHATFRLWAPNAKERPELVLRGDSLPMREAGEGFYEVGAEGCAVGMPYRFKVAGRDVPDPASRRQEENVHGASVICDPAAYPWQHKDFRARPFGEALIYECHVGTFSEEGTFGGLEKKLDHLVDLGVNTLELMPLAQFSGSRGWGYDGVLPYAVHNTYGSPDELCRLVDACHGRGLAVMLDVVYNHFGPDGNYLHLYAKDFFDDEVGTPWGAALDFSRQPVRDFFIENALMWLVDYRLDGLRFDAVHAIDAEAGGEPFLRELSRTIEEHQPGRRPYLVLENDDNAATLIGSDRPFTAQWNDDLHHVLHRIATGETDGYYGDYEDRAAQRLLRCLSEGFDYQGEPSPHRGGRKRGEPSADRPPSAFVSFVQNHDQVGNRAEGERISDAAAKKAVEVVTAIYLLCPQVPMLWMGEEWAASARFPFFCDFEGDLADAVREGRRREFAQFKRFQDEKAREAIPDPNAPETFRLAKLDWSEKDEEEHSDRLSFYKTLIALRRSKLLPIYMTPFRGAEGESGEKSFRVRWSFEGGALWMCGRLGGGHPQEDPAGTVLMEIGKKEEEWHLAIGVSP